MNFADNPFLLLDASPRDSKRTLHEKAESKSFELDEGVCRNAERILLNPKKRLEAEMSWFPGVSPNKVKDILRQVIEDTHNHNYDSDFFSQFDNLPRSNAFAYFLSNISDSGNWKQEEVENIVRDFCEFASEIDADSTLDSINEDRNASGFPEVPCMDGIVTELEEQQHYYKKILHSFLDMLDSHAIVDTLTDLIEENTMDGDCECDWPLLDAIIAEYEMDVIPFFEKQEKMIELDITEMIKEMEAKKKWNQLQDLFVILRSDILLWDRIAQPIQVLLRSKGIEHKRSQDLSYRLRDFSVLAHNQYGCTELSIKMTELQQSVFAELRIAAEKAADDKKQLQHILHCKEIQKMMDDKREKQRQREKTYSSIYQFIAWLISFLFVIFIIIYSSR